jgi:hypothetical protein
MMMANQSGSWQKRFATDPNKIERQCIIKMMIEAIQYVPGHNVYCHLQRAQIDEQFAGESLHKSRENA